MAQHDFNIANATFPSVRSDINSALTAINTSQSGTSRPASAVAGTIWLDTTSATTPTLKYYDGADDISLATLDHTANTVNWLDSTVSITGLSSTATATVLTLSDSENISTVNLIIDNDKEIRFREATANGTNYVSLSAPASLSADLTFTLPATDGTSGQVLVTNGSGVLSFATIASSFADGTAGSPSITFTSDTNTGIFRPSSDTIAFTEGGVESLRIDSSANLKFNSGFGSVETAYGCRAWVNFDGSANTNLTGTYTRTSPSTTLTVTATAHGLIVGSSVNLDFTSGTGLDGIYTVVTVADANTFTVTTVASTTTSGNVTLLRNTIRGSGNVSSITDNGLGDYTVNFTTAMPDVNYAFLGGGSYTSARTGVLSINPDAKLVGSVRMIHLAMNLSSSAIADAEQASVSIFR